MSQQPEDKGDQGQDEPAVGVGEIVLPHPMTVKKDGATVGGTLNVAIVTDTPFEGIFNYILIFKCCRYSISRASTIRIHEIRSKQRNSKWWMV